MADTNTPASIRRLLSERFESLALFKRNRDTALHHFCIAIEMIPVPLSDNPDFAMAKGRHAVEASMRAVPAIFRLCSTSPSSSSFEINSAALAEASQVIDFASRYDAVMYCFELADRGQFEVHYDPLGQRTVFSYASADESAADTLLRTHERDSKIVQATAADHARGGTLVLQIKEELSKTILFTSPDEVTYTWSPSLLTLAKKYAEYAVSVLPWEFPNRLLKKTVCRPNSPRRGRDSADLLLYCG